MRIMRTTLNLIAFVILVSAAQAAEIPPAWLCTYTSRVQAIDVDTREPVTVQVRALRDNDISSISTEQIAEGAMRVEFHHNTSNAWFRGSNPPPVVCWAEAQDYGLEMISLAGTNDLVIAYMEAEQPTVLYWRKERHSMPREAIGRSDTNELRRILLTDDYLPKFQEAYWYAKPWEIESYYIRWRQTAAIQAAKKRPTAFAHVLVEYYFGSEEKAKAMSAEEQIRTASLKQIEQGKLYVDGLGGGKKEYKVENINYTDKETAVVEAAFHAFLAGRGHRLRFRLFVVDGVKIWLPVTNDRTWIS